MEVLFGDVYESGSVVSFAFDELFLQESDHVFGCLLCSFLWSGFGVVYVYVASEFEELFVIGKAEGAEGNVCFLPSFAKEC